MISRTSTAAVALVAALALTGCNGTTDEPDPTLGTAPTTATPEPDTATATTEPPDDDTETTTAPPELSAEEQDQADIEETLHLYVSALDDARTGEASIEEIYPYSRDTAREKWVTQVMAYEAQGITIEGNVDLEVVDISVEDDFAEVIACADVSGTDALDENGESIVPADRLDRTLNDFTLERDGSAELGWYVTDDVNRNEPCDG